MASQSPASSTGNDSTKKIASARAALNYDDILASRVAFGDPSELIDRLRQWHEVLTIDGVIMELNAGGLLSESQVLESTRIVAEEVMPAFK